MRHQYPFLFVVWLVLTNLESVVLSEDSCLHNPQDSRPNIILIMADDLGWKDLNCYGNSSLDTPVIDRLASEGMRFTDAYSASPVCSPTRAAIMTGLAPARLKITNHAPGHPPGFTLPGTKLKSAEWTRHLTLEHVTIAERLKAAGYATAFVGKWHLSHRPKNAPAPSEIDLRPEQQGFDLNVGGCDFGGPPSYFAPFKNPAIIKDGDDEYLPDRLAKDCISFVHEHRNQPFFLCWWNYSVHYPFQAPRKLIEKYERRKNELEMGIKNPTYSAMIEGMDRSIGRLLDTVELLGLSKNTLVIFTSDNGPFAADVRPLREEKGHLYEGGIRVPFIVRWPGVVKAGTECSIPVISMDVFSTIMSVAKLSTTESFDGEDLTPLLSQTDSLKREAIYFHYPNYAFHKKNRLGSAIRQGDFKLIKFYDDNSSELYNLVDDIGEQTNLANAMPKSAMEMNAKLDAWLKETKANLPQFIE